MIQINTFKIDETGLNLLLDVTSNEGSNIESILIWNDRTFKEYEKAVDMSFNIVGEDNNEAFSMSAEDFDVTKFTGIWFVEIRSNERVSIEDASETNVALGITANLLPYWECVLDNVLLTDFEGCTPTLEEDCEDCVERLFYVNTLVESVSRAIQAGFYNEAIEIIKTLDDICEVCSDCPDYEDTSLIGGAGFGVINNSIVIL